jgi:twitching motility two-component system response regulator PilH
MARILIVEDSPSQAALISELIREAGHEPIMCNDLSIGAAQVVQSTQPQVVLLDLVLLGPDGKPLADGFQICREIKRVSQNKIGVIVVSAKGDEESAEWALLQGADAFLGKPFAVQDLITVLDAVLQHKSKAKK